MLYQLSYSRLASKAAGIVARSREHQKERFFYLVRPLLPFMGSWGRSSAGAERVVACP